MKRAVVLIIVGLAYLLTIPSVAHARYVDGMNMYECVRSNPVVNCDPAGLLAVKGANDFGDWDITQNNKRARIPGDTYHSEVIIKFIPNKKTVCCDEITFIQVCKTLDSEGNPYEPREIHSDRMTSTGWRLDQSIGNKIPWYVDHPQYGQYGSAPDPYREATLIDDPGDKVTSQSWFFETVAICKKGPDQGTVYGALRWGFEVDDMGHLTSHTPASGPMYSQNFFQAILRWNQQSGGPMDQRNAPDQEPYGGPLPIPYDTGPVPPGRPDNFG